MRVCSTVSFYVFIISFFIYLLSVLFYLFIVPILLCICYLSPSAAAAETAAAETAAERGDRHVYTMLYLARIMFYINK